MIDPKDPIAELEALLAEAGPPRDLAARSRGLLPRPGPALRREPEPAACAAATKAAPSPKPKRTKRRPDPVAVVKRAMAAGLNVRTVNVTAEGVLLTLDDEVPAPADATVIETADELRKLI